MPLLRSSSRIGRRLLGLFALWVPFALAGCGGSETLHAVNGKVTSGGQSVTGGIVNFIPDAANKSGKSATGMIDSDGSYTVATEGKKGAMAGKYKVTISTMLPPGADVPEASGGIKPGTGTSGAPKPAVAVNPKYLSPTSSTITIDVPSTAGYDLKLDK